MRTGIIILILISLALPFERLNRKEKNEFKDSYEMILKGYSAGKYNEVESFGRKTIEDFKVIPLDDKVPDLQKMYVDIFYLVGKAGLHLNLKAISDSIIKYRNMDEFYMMAEQGKKLKEQFEKSGILNKKDDPEYNYFRQFYRDATIIIDSIPVLVGKTFDSLKNDRKKGDYKAFADKYEALKPGLKELSDSLDNKDLEETYYTLINSDNASAIDSFIIAHKNYYPDRVLNLKNHLETLLGDEYMRIRKAKSGKAIEEFLEKYPGTKYQADLLNRLEWYNAKDAMLSSNIYYCRQYMEKYPQGKYFKEVSTRFDQLAQGVVQPGRVPDWEE